jgi:hypothetical protein
MGYSVGFIHSWSLDLILVESEILLTAIVHIFQIIIIAVVLKQCVVGRIAENYN